MQRQEFIDILATTYYKFLKDLPFEQDPYMMMALKETQGKFIANLHIEIAKLHLPRSRNERRFATDYVSKEAEEILKQGSTKGLRFEHIVPKSEYIIKPCQEKAMNGELTYQYVRDRLDRYYWTATVKKWQDDILNQRKMPGGWKEKDIFARYREKNIMIYPYKGMLTYNAKERVTM